MAGDKGKGWAKLSRPQQSRCPPFGHSESKDMDRGRSNSRGGWRRSPLRGRRARSESRSSDHSYKGDAPPPRKQARLRDTSAHPEPASTTAQQCAAAPTQPAPKQANPLPTQSQPSSGTDDRDKRIKYLEIVAELLRRDLMDAGRPTHNVWAEQLILMDSERLLAQRRAYETEHLAPSQAELDPYGDDGDDDDYDFRNHVKEKKRRRKAAQAKGIWKTRTTESSSREMNEEERAAAKQKLGTARKLKVAPPLEERLEPFPSQPGPSHRERVLDRQHHF